MPNKYQMTPTKGRHAAGTATKGPESPPRAASDSKLKGALKASAGASVSAPIPGTAASDSDCSSSDLLVIGSSVDAPGRVRTSSTESSRAHPGEIISSDDEVEIGQQGKCDIAEDGDAMTPKTTPSQSSGSPNCVIAAASGAAISICVQECGGTEVSIVSPTIGGGSYQQQWQQQQQHHSPSIMAEAPATPRAAQLILEDCQRGIASSRKDSYESPNKSPATRDLSSLFLCGVADIVTCQKDLPDGLSSSPTIRPVHLAEPITPRMSHLALTDTAGRETNVHEFHEKSSSGIIHPLSNVPPTPPALSDAIELTQPPKPEPTSPMGPKISCAGNNGSEPCGGRDTPCNFNTPDDSLQAQQQTAIEATIGNFLSSPGDWCDGWQAWSVHMSAVCDGSSSALPAIDQTDVKTVLRNRAGDLNSRRRRIARLRRDLSPFDLMQPGGGSGSGVTGQPMAGADFAGASSAAGLPASRDGVTTPPLAPGHMKKSRSFADASSALLPRTADDNSSVVSMTSSVIEAIQNCDADSVGNPGHRRRNDPMRMSTVSNRSVGMGSTTGEASDDQDDDLCYDSDPGDAGSTCKMQRHRSLADGASSNERSSTATASSSDEKNRKSVDMFLKRGGAWNSDKNVEEAPIDPTNDAHVIKAVDGILHRRMTLVWHQIEGPVAVYAWVELGSQLRSALIQPKLMWKPVHETENNRGALGITNHINLHSVDLLDISRILAANRIDRKLHPLAKRNCSLSIETFDHSLLFETSSQKERDTLVKGLKGLVARLASKIIVGDERVFDEYFTPFGAVVPGDAPDLLAGFGSQNPKQ